ncbi:MAG TPA: hypothetical protein DEG17_14655 [Cyanobacteria bacterium UBA11149]|nr:hypothetical protein [Cyanobacteria bacterium UBA11367]HBE58549.1 hypothetical protein [Cyanobacteria bacterium UBA11366]HBK64780.1 hypothetical protein [Cyanobacteria bacterium UBA11166]HBR76515.1 hypothetical protein [Cyanobacteria bacterium UBA11159]HBS67885.1 hypothetical protein [Cyanobacteria bacterium UBA11153]HBW90076.1 hypothetical protein [Cyanobacteria bacterium UBA11149]HCA93736.1 hypothetical protein [Cyanobacteria bacterium UBA9226]
MPFSAYKTIGTVLKEFKVTYIEANFIVETAFNISDYFREDLEIVRRDNVVTNSEYAICEYIIVPILKEVWKQYRKNFILWSHQALNCDANLNGFPEYILAKKSPLGKLVFDRPYFVIIEAKQDDFEAGWAQCLAEMVAAQRLNEKPEQDVFGIVANGKLWQFGKLKINVFTLNQKSYLIDDLEKLFAAINYIFQQCELLLNSDTVQTDVT